VLEGIFFGGIVVGTSIEFREFNSIDRLIISIGGGIKGVEVQQQARLKL